MMYLTNCASAGYQEQHFTLKYQVFYQGHNCINLRSSIYLCNLYIYVIISQNQTHILQGSVLACTQKLALLCIRKEEKHRSDSPKQNQWLSER